MKNKIQENKGGSAVEFAVVLPLLLILVFGIIEFSLIMYNKAVITNASREGARAGIVARWNGTTYNPLTDTEIKSKVTDYCGAYLVGFGTPKDTPVPTVSWLLPDGSETFNVADRLNNKPPDYSMSVKVNVSYDYHFLAIPAFISTIGGNDKLTKLQATTVMRME